MNGRLPLIPRGLGMLLLLALLSGCAPPSSWLFYPMKPLLQTPADLGLAYQDVALTAADGTRLHGWYLPPEGEPRGNLLYLHGNAENISTHVISVAWLPAAGYGVLALDYRGFGRSEGVPMLPAVFEDLTAASDWLVGHTDPPHFVLGQSLGAALAVELISDNPAGPYNALLLDAPFTRYRTMGRHALSGNWFSRWLLAPAADLLPDGYDPIDQINTLGLPVLFYASANDAIVPLELTQALFDAAASPKQLSLHQGGHIATFRDPEQRRLTLEFLQRYATEGPQSR